MSLIPDDMYETAQTAFNDAQPLVSEYRTHAFDLIQNRTDMDDVVVKVDLMQHVGQLLQGAPNAQAAVGFLMAALAEALHQLGMADHAAFAAMFQEIEGLPTAGL